MSRVLIVIFLLQGIAYSLHIPNHKGISSRAVRSSQWMKFFMQSMHFEFEKDVNGNNAPQEAILDLIRNGAKDEDGWRWVPDDTNVSEFLSETVARTTNHFYDPIHQIPLNDRCDWRVDLFPRGETAVDWALSANGGSMNNIYSLPALRDYLYDGLTAVNRAQRSEKLSQFFLGVGHLIHLLQDMAVPAHVRNDIHMYSFTLEPYFSVVDIGSDRFEAYVSEKGENYETAPIGTRLYNSYEDFWHNEAYTGLADFTNSNFLSQDTNLDNRLILCRQGVEYYFPTVDSFRDREEWHNDIPIMVRYYYNTVHDEYSNQDYYNNNLSVSSLWNYLTESYSDRRIFSLNEDCFATYSHLLLPRATSYSIGLLDFIFRGQLQIGILAGNDPGTQIIHVINWSANYENMTNGMVTIVAHYRGESGDQSDETWQTIGSFPLQLLVNTHTDPTAYWQQIVSIQNWENVKDITVIYRGGLGQELDEIIASQYDIKPFGFFEINEASVTLKHSTNDLESGSQCQSSSPYNPSGSQSEFIKETKTDRRYVGILHYFQQAELTEIDLQVDCGVLLVDGQAYQGKWMKNDPSTPNPTNLEIIYDADACPFTASYLGFRFENRSDTVVQYLPGKIVRDREHWTHFSASQYTGTPYSDCRCYHEIRYYLDLSSLAKSVIRFDSAQVISVNGYTEDFSSGDGDYFSFKDSYAYRTNTEEWHIEQSYFTIKNIHLIEYDELYDPYHSICNCSEGTSCWNTCQHEQQHSFSLDALKQLTCETGNSDLELMHPILSNEYQNASIPNPLQVRAKILYPFEAKLHGYEYKILDIPIMEE